MDVKISTEPTNASDFLDVSEHDFVRSVKEQQNKCLEQRHLQLLLTLWNGMRAIRHWRSSYQEKPIRLSYPLFTQLVALVCCSYK